MKNKYLGNFKVEYDVFICHASEDKKSFVEPLVGKLRDSNLKVWYDGFELKLGDNLREKIDYGLANSRYGVVILSKSFFKKEWPKTELDALVARQNNVGKKVILPVWHEVEAEEVGKFSPILASKLAARSSDGIDALVAQVFDVCSEKELPNTLSVFQDKGKYGLREQCLDIIRQDDLIAWRKLIDEVTEPIPEQLKKWKQDKGDMAAQKGGKDWEDTLLEAGNICLPGFIPIFSAVETGKKNYWKESFGLIRRLAVLKDEMGGGFISTINIGNYMLYVVGRLGMSIAVGLKLFDLIDEWMILKMPNELRNGEVSWLQNRSAHYPPGGLQVDIKEPFKFLLKISEFELIKGFFPNQKRLANNLLMSNLLASMVEFRVCCQTTNCNKALMKREQLVFDVLPYWCLAKPEEFRSLTLNLFGDSDGVIKFVFPQMSAISVRFWQYWQHWQEACVGVWMQSSRYDLFNARFLKLPGQPDLKDDDV